MTAILGTDPVGVRVTGGTPLAGSGDPVHRVIVLRERVFASCGTSVALPSLVPGHIDAAIEAVSVLTRLCSNTLGHIRTHQSDEADELAGLVLDLQNIATDLYLIQMSRRTARMAECSATLNRLRQFSSTSELLERVCEEASRRCGFGRVVLSRVENRTWRPWKAYFDEPDGQSSWFVDWIDRRIPFDAQTPEHGLLNERRPRIVYDTATAPVHRPIIIESGQSRSYVVSPLSLENTVVGLFHADHHPNSRRIEPVDRDILWAFTEGVGYVYERALLMESMRERRDQVRALLVTAVGRMDDLCESGLRIGVSDHDQPGGRSEPIEQLTAREQEVFALMADGATNSEIADRLVIAEGTVKSHVKHILRKLGAGNRSQAIAWSISTCN
jgi:DNA-binding CsgD family transcriptional regulator